MVTQLHRLSIISHNKYKFFPTIRPPLNHLYCALFHFLFTKMSHYPKALHYLNKIPLRIRPLRQEFNQLPTFWQISIYN